MFCIRPEFVDKLKNAFRNGEITPEKLRVTSEAREELLTKYVDKDTAKEISLLFEKKELLKNQEKAMYDFGKEVFGTNTKAKEAFNEKVRQAHNDKTRRLLNPAENEAFLNEIASDIYSKKYGTEVTLQEAQNITELARDMEIAKGDFEADPTNKEAGLKFGASKVALDNYVGKLREDIGKETLQNPLKADSLGEAAQTVVDNARISFNFIADNSRSIVASMDNSLWFRQGMKALVNPSHTKAWANNFVESWKDIGKTIVGGTKAGDAVLDGVKAEIYSRPNYLNGRYELGKKLDIGTGEEAFPTSLPSRIPLLGRLFKASEVAYEAGAMRLRVDIADKMYEMAEKSGVDLTDKKIVGDINEVVNSMTGRGRLGAGEKSAKFVNKAFFSIKFLKSNYDTLTLHSGKLSPFARKQAAINLLSVISSVGIVLAIAKALNPDDNEDVFDPRSSKFGKISFGKNITMDITAGMGGLVILASRLISQSTKNAKTGIVTKLNEGYGSPDGIDTLVNFTENKFSPMFSVLRDVVNQKDRKGNKPTLASEAKGLLVPIPFQNAMELKDEKKADAVIAMLADAVGFSSNAGSYPKDWEQDPTKELQQFKDKVGSAKFKEANDEYNQRVVDRIDSITHNELYEKLSNDDKKRLIAKERASIKKSIFKEYGFKPKTVKQDKLPKL